MGDMEPRIYPEAHPRLHPLASPVEVQVQFRRAWRCRSLTLLCHRSQQEQSPEVLLERRLEESWAPSRGKRIKSSRD